MMRSFLANSIAVGFASMRAGAASVTTTLADVIVPEIFTQYVQQLTEEKSRLIASGAIARDSQMDTLLAGGGATFNLPSWFDLANDDDNISGDDDDDRFVTGGAKNSKPKKTRAGKEVAVRLSRNQSWAAADLTVDLAGADPMASIASRVAAYWTRRLQKAFVSVAQGVFAHNAAAPGADKDHVQNDMIIDLKPTPATGAPTAAEQFSASALIDALTTMGDSADQLTMIMVHSVVYSRMQKNNLITFIPDARGEITIPTFLGREVIVDDGVPFDAASGKYDTWLFGAGAFRLGVGSPKVPTETERLPSSGNGGGSEVLYNRHEWLIHPTGYAYVGAVSTGGPANTVLAAAASWKRVYAERKQIKMACLRSKEKTTA